MHFETAIINWKRKSPNVKMPAGKLLRPLVLGLLLAVVIPANVLAFKPYHSRSSETPDSAGVILAPWAIRHIKERHWPDSPAPGAGKYAEGITVEMLRQLIDEAVTRGQSRPNTQGRPGTLFEYDFRRPIGTTIDGGPATRIRVVLNQRREVVTAFPF